MGGLTGSPKMKIIGLPDLILFRQAAKKPALVVGFFALQLLH